MKYYIGIDNGVTGSICIIDEVGDLIHYCPTPVKKTLNYTKAVSYLNRVVGAELEALLRPFKDSSTVIIERPLVNPGRWAATVSALRCDEATRIILEMLDMRFQYVDSREWQTPMLPKRKPLPKIVKGATPEEKKVRKALATKYKAETKTLSLTIGQQLFPQLILKGDADAICMAEWARREKL